MLTLFLVIAILVIPDAQVGKLYEHKIDNNVSDCIVSTKPPAPRDVKYGLPGGLKLFPDGNIKGTPKKAGEYQFDVVCKEKKVRISLIIE